MKIREFIHENPVSANEMQMVDEARQDREEIKKLTLEVARLSDFLCYTKQNYPDVYSAYIAALKDLASNQSNVEPTHE